MRPGEGRTGHRAFLGTRHIRKPRGVGESPGRHGRKVVALGAKEVLYTARRHYGDEAARTGCQIGDSVWNLAGKPQEATSSQDTPLFTDLVVQLTVKHDHDLVLRMVDVEWWSAGLDDALENSHESVRLLPGHLQGQHAAAAHVQVLERLAPLD